MGSGGRFKSDLLSYLRGYGTKLKELIADVNKYDFTAIRAALVASTPGRQNIRTQNGDRQTLWGWPGLKYVLEHVPDSSTSSPRIVVQVSSIATLGVEDKWLRQTFFRALRSRRESTAAISGPNFSIVWPTADEIRRSNIGYSSGGSIHMKTQTAQQIRQLNYIQPMLCHWAGDRLDRHSNTNTRQAGRRRACPHIKTYIKFTDDNTEKIDWAMVTSANLSKQAWGSEATAIGTVRVCSYELGVVVWPGLWEEPETETAAEMVPVFKQDDPPMEKTAESKTPGRSKVTVGLRMPYDLPLVPYSKDEDIPWCAITPDTQPDWMGRAWPGYGAL